MNSQQLIEKEKSDIKRLPITDPRFIADKNSLLIEGDMHGNSGKLLWQLKDHDFIEYDRELHKEFTLIYHLPIEHWTRDTIDQMISIIDRIVVKESAKGANLLLMGDTLADRGKLDFITLLIYKKLHESGINLVFDNNYWAALLSNHDAELIINVETFQRFDHFTFLGDPTQGQSMANMQILIDKGILTRKEIVQLIKQYYLPHLKLIEYTYAEDASNSYYLHAPFGDDTIERLAAQFKIKLHHPDEDRLKTHVELCDEINQAFEKHKNNGTIHTLLDPNDAVHEAIWNRETAHLVRNENNRYINGHDPDIENLPNVFNLDNTFGKGCTPEDSEGKYHALYSHESRHKNNTHFGAQLEIIKNNPDFMNCVKLLSKSILNVKEKNYEEKLSEIILSLDHTHSQYRINALQYLFIDNAKKFTSLLSPFMINTLHDSLEFCEQYILIDICYLIMKNNNTISKELLSELLKIEDNQKLEILFVHLNSCISQNDPFDDETILNYLGCENNLLIAFEELSQKKSLSLFDFYNLETMYEAKTVEDLEQINLEYNLLQNILVTYASLVDQQTLETAGQEMAEALNDDERLAISIQAAMMVHPDIKTLIASHFFNGHHELLYMVLFFCRLMGQNNITLFQDDFIAGYLENTSFNNQQMENLRAGFNALIVLTNIDNASHFDLNLDDENSIMKTLLVQFKSLARLQVLKNLTQAIYISCYEKNTPFSQRELIIIMDSVERFIGQLKNLFEYNLKTMQSFLLSPVFKIFLNSALAKKDSLSTETALHEMQQLYPSFAKVKINFNKLNSTLSKHSTFAKKDEPNNEEKNVSEKKNKK